MWAVGLKGPHGLKGPEVSSGKEIHTARYSIEMESLDDIAVYAVLDRLRAAAMCFGNTVVADTTWKNDVGPSFAVLVKDERAYRVMVSSTDTFVYGPFTVSTDWVADAVEGSSESDVEYEEINTVEELTRILGG